MTAVSCFAHTARPGRPPATPFYPRCNKSGLGVMGFTRNSPEPLEQAASRPLSLHTGPPSTALKFLSGRCTFFAGGGKMPRGCQAAKLSAKNTKRHISAIKEKSSSYNGNYMNKDRQKRQRSEIGHGLPSQVEAVAVDCSYACPQSDEQ